MNSSLEKFLWNIAKRNLSTQEKNLIEIYKVEEDIEDYKEYLYWLADDYQEMNDS